MGTLINLNVNTITIILKWTTDNLSRAAYLGGFYDISNILLSALHLRYIASTSHVLSNALIPHGSDVLMWQWRGTEVLQRA